MQWLMIFFCWICWGKLVHAQVSEPETSTVLNNVSITMSGDNVGGQNTSLSLDLLILPHVRWNVGVAGSSVKSDTAATPAKTAQSFWTGMDYQWNENFESGVQLSTWGMRDELMHRVVYIPFLMAYKNWDFLLRPGGGEVEFETNTSRTQAFLFKDRSFLLNLGYTFETTLRIGFAHEMHNYSSHQNVEFSDLSSDQAAIFFSEATLSLAASILKKRSGLEVAYRFDKLDLGISSGRVESAFDGSISRYFEVFSSFEANKNWLLGGAIGGTRSDADIDPLTGERLAPIRYLELSAAYNF